MLTLIDGTLNDEDIQLLADWRNANNFAYKDQVVATPESIRHWLVTHYFSKPRMLFWVIYEGKKIGMMGLNFEHGCEIDSCIRGDPSGPGQMGTHLEILVGLGERLGHTVTLRVIKTNTHAISFYFKHGFWGFFTDDTYLHMRYGE